MITKYGFECGASAELASGKFAKPGSKASYAPDQLFDTEHILLELAVDFRQKSVAGKCTTAFRAIVDQAREIHFDAARLKILKAYLVDGQRLKFSHKGEKLTVRLPRALEEGGKISVVIEYKITDSMAGVYFVGPDKAYPKKPVQVWTHGEAEESRYWFPCFDAPHDKASTEMIVTVPADYFALSNGALIDVRQDKRNRTKIYHWKQAIPHSPYLVTMVAGKFSEIKDEWDGIPVLYYCQPGREKEVKRAFGKTPKMLQFFSEKIGVRYPYEKYAQIAVADFVMGGMEHTTATTQTDRVLMDATAYPEFTADWLVSHELAHQWFGDLLTCKEWSHAWLNESFATYFEALFTEHDLGKDEFNYEMHEKLESYLDEDRKVYRRAIVTNVYRKPDDLFDRHLYEKGSLVLHALRGVLGDELFWKAIGHYVSTHFGQAVETNDLINAIQESTGKNMRKFFDQWVYNAGHPEFTVDYWWDPKTKNAHVRVLQKTDGKNSFSSVPVQFEFTTRQGRRKPAETLEEKKHEFKYHFLTEPLDFRFDPEYKILKTAEIHKPRAMWMRQLEGAQHVMGRIDAAKHLGQIATDETVRILARAFTREKFWGSAREMALAIGKTKLKSARDFLLRSLSVPHPKVRRGVAEALGEYHDPETLSALKRSFAREKSYFVRAEIIRSLSAANSPELQDWIKKQMNTPSWNETIRATALSSLARVPDANALSIARRHARYGEHPSVRGAALQTLFKFARPYPELFQDLLSLAGDSQVRIRQAAISALGNLKHPQAIPVLKKISEDKNLPYRTRALADDALLKITPSQNSN